MISSIYKQKLGVPNDGTYCDFCSHKTTLYTRLAKGGLQLTAFQCRNPKCPHYGKEKELHRRKGKRPHKPARGPSSEQSTARIKKNSRYFVRKVTYSDYVIACAKIVYETWRWALDKFAKYEETIVLRFKEGVPFSETGLEAAICDWIRTNPDTWVDDWTRLLELFPEVELLRCGYDGWFPSISWLFARHPKGTGLERLLQGRYDLPPQRRSEDEGMV